MENINQTLLYVGIGCILAAIAGGGFKGLGIEVPLLATLRRQLLLAFFGVALIAGLFGYKYATRPSVDATSEVAAGLRKYDVKDRFGALPHFRAAAEAGHPEGQYRYGEMLFHGEGTPGDRAGGVEWLTRSAKSGFAQAQAGLANHLLSDGDIAASRTWAERSTAQGSAWGHLVLAQIHSREASPDMEAILSHMRFAAEGGFPDAQLTIGLALLKESKVDATHAPLAINWLARAAKQGSMIAQCMVARTMYDLEKSSPAKDADHILVLQMVLRCLHHWREVQALMGGESTRLVVEGIRREYEKKMSLDNRLVAAKRAEEWTPVYEGPVRHGHFEGSRK